MDNTELTFEKFGTTFKVGDRVTGIWKMKLPGHPPYRAIGTIIHHPSSGFWVESEGNTGITGVDLFTELKHLD
jgi:hypothetical protein